MKSIMKRFRQSILLVAALNLFLIQALPVSAMFIDFETYPDGTPTGAYDTIDAQFSAWGVAHMDSLGNNLTGEPPVIAKYADYPLGYDFPSMDSALAPHPNTTAPPPSGYTGTFGAAQAPIYLYFVSPLSYFSIYALDVGYNGLEVDAYDANSSLLDSFTIDDLTRSHNGTNVTGNGLDFIEFTTAGISKISFSQIRDADWDRANSLGLEGYLLDNMTLTMVPEPASAFLLASGLLGLAGFLRRR